MGVTDGCDMTEAFPGGGDGVALIIGVGVGTGVVVGQTLV